MGGVAESHGLSFSPMQPAPPSIPRSRPRTAKRAVATQEWHHLPPIDGPRDRLSSTGAIDGRLAAASDGRPANEPRLLAPPSETLARLLRFDSGRNAIVGGPHGEVQPLKLRARRKGENHRTGCG